MRRLYDASFGVLHITDLWLGPSRHLHDEPLGVSNMVSEKRMVNMRLGHTPRSSGEVTGRHLREKCWQLEP